MTHPVRFEGVQTCAQCSKVNQASPSPTSQPRPCPLQLLHLSPGSDTTPKVRLHAATLVKCSSQRFPSPHPFCAQFACPSSRPFPLSCPFRRSGFRSTRTNFYKARAAVHKSSPCSCRLNHGPLPKQYLIIAINLQQHGHGPTSPALSVPLCSCLLLTCPEPCPLTNAAVNLPPTSLHASHLTSLILRPLSLA